MNPYIYLAVFDRIVRIPFHLDILFQNSFWDLFSVNFFNSRKNFVFNGISFLDCNRGDLSTLIEYFVLGEYPEVECDVLIDCGANIGAVSLGYAKKGAFVVALEPVPSIYKKLNINIKENNNTKNILPLQRAVCNSDFVELYLHDSTTSSTKCRSKNSIKVKGITLGSLIQKYAKGKTSLKMDIEGEEYPALLSLSNSELDSLDSIFFEYHFYDKEAPSLLKKCSDKLLDNEFSLSYSREYLGGKYGILLFKKN
ncbi:FkbM family methyltransferase [Candidatus Micrarchaeota archaeon]|nr:FkbM family methyltransferase [Candidatus Micrarchaeota archaeon]